jgi:hypothetical protein
MSKYTPWFPASVRPVRVGWYMAKGCFWDNRNNPRLYVMRYWNGRNWEWASPFIGGRLTSASMVPGSDKWRGLARKPR